MPISTKLSAGRVRSTYEFIKANGDKYSVHGRQSLARSSRLSNPALVGRQAIPPDPQPPAAAVHGDAAKQCLGNRYRLHSDVARLALPGRRHGPVLAQDRRLVRGTDHSPRSRARRGADGRAPATPPRHGNSFGPRAAVRQRRRASLLPLQSPRAEHEPEGNCWDNAVAEAFFSRLKKERIKKQIYKNRELPLNDVADYIDRFYKRTRRHNMLWRGRIRFRGPFASKPIARCAVELQFVEPVG